FRRVLFRSQFPQITYYEAKTFKDGFNYPAVVSLSTYASFGGTVKYKSEQTNPNINVLGADENYLQTAGYNLSTGRNFSLREVEYGSNVVIVGSEIVKRLFKNNEEPLNEVIRIGKSQYTIIVVLEDKESSAVREEDETCIVPLVKARAVMALGRPSYTITVMAGNPQQIEMAIGEATALFRNIRGVRVGQETNFEITKSDAVAQMLIESLTYVTIGAVVIALI